MVTIQKRRRYPTDLLKGIVILLLLPGAPANAQELMPASSSGWTTFAPRTQTAPVSNASTGGSGYVLNIYGNGVTNVYGGWRTRIQGLQGGGYYRFPHTRRADRHRVSSRIADDYLAMAWIVRR
jgi:hypothetical protein